MDKKVKEALEALASGNASLFACLWNAHREKSFAYHNGRKRADDPFQPLYDKAKELLSPGRPEDKKTLEKYPFGHAGIPSQCRTCKKMISYTAPDLQCNECSLIELSA
jgi:hypothetical protein